MFIGYMDIFLCEVLVHIFSPLFITSCVFSFLHVVVLYYGYESFVRYMYYEMSSPSVWHFHSFHGIL